MPKVLVSDSLSETAVQIFRDNNISARCDWRPLAHLLAHHLLYNCVRRTAAGGDSERRRANVERRVSRTVRWDTIPQL